MKTLLAIATVFAVSGQLAQAETHYNKFSGICVGRNVQGSSGEVYSCGPLGSGQPPIVFSYFDAKCVSQKCANPYIAFTCNNGADGKIPCSTLPTGTIFFSMDLPYSDPSGPFSTLNCQAPDIGHLDQFSCVVGSDNVRAIGCIYGAGQRDDVQKYYCEP